MASVLFLLRVVGLPLVYVGWCIIMYNVAILAVGSAIDCTANDCPVPALTQGQKAQNRLHFVHNSQSSFEVKRSRSQGHSEICPESQMGICIQSSNKDVIGLGLDASLRTEWKALPSALVVKFKSLLSGLACSPWN